jgi:hypothetical protein
MAKTKAAKPRRARARRNNNKLALGGLGAVGAAIVQGQIHRRLAPTSRQAPRVIAIVSGLASIGATMMGHETAGAVLLGPACSQAGIESSLVDMMPTTDKK